MGSLVYPLSGIAWFGILFCNDAVKNFTTIDMKQIVRITHPKGKMVFGVNKNILTFTMFAVSVLKHFQTKLETHQTIKESRLQESASLSDLWRRLP